MHHATERFPAQAADRVMDRIFRYRASRRAFRILLLFAGSALLFFALFSPFQSLQGPEHRITFTLYAPEARQVSLVGDFNQWGEPGIPMTETQSGEWTVTLKLEPGSYRYLFSVDGGAVPDPRSALLADPYGRDVSLVHVNGSKEEHI
ncbi:MAG TPA: hypothetical protein PLF44_01360 [Candidatus Mcinerneyibacteriales bacterium]|nr:hypothetical protein [Candidatus Mcinerneyibacteriales bacterium]HPE20227.1 hypothetical protein [Candidatus Mcinerneyibacteriales bacterium]HPJ69508.1 hypothetical protein [Candidatus Mcinerneyibacteriales bacterium]